MPTDPRVDAYIERQAAFAQPILTELRKRLHATHPGIGETIKWSMPFFEYDGQLLANMAAFKAHASFGFWRGAALAEAKAGAGKAGEAMGQFGKLTQVEELPDTATFAALVHEAIALITRGDGKIKRGVRPAKAELAVPEALAAALAADPLAAATFNGFPPSCRRDYCEWIGEAKREETRAKRVGEAISWLREGKKRHWKYEAC